MQPDKAARTAQYSARRRGPATSRRVRAWRWNWTATLFWCPIELRCRHDGVAKRWHVPVLRTAVVEKLYFSISWHLARRMWFWDVVAAALAAARPRAAAERGYTHALADGEFGNVSESVVDAVTESTSPRPLASTTLLQLEGEGAVGGGRGLVFTVSG